MRVAAMAAAAEDATALSSGSKRPRQSAPGDDGDNREAVDEDFFGAYDDLAIHALMLNDGPRVDAYLAALRYHKDKLEGKVLLDVGAGSAVLSMLAAKHANVKKVYAVEATPGMARVARELVAKNGLADVVEVVEGLVEDVQLPEMVDAIVSEWMGFYLVHESMLQSVLVARDRFLKPGGLVLPGSARIWAAPVEAEDVRREIEGYSNVHGLDMSVVGEAELSRRCQKPEVELVSPERLLARPICVASFPDLSALPAGSTRSFSADAEFVALRAGRAAAVAFWFDVGFGGDGVMLDTSPGAPATHWKQTLVYLGVFAPVEPGDVLPARLVFEQSSANPRQYDITVET